MIIFIVLFIVITLLREKVYINKSNHRGSDFPAHLLSLSLAFLWLT
jgi:hypothetical protein